MNDNQVGRAIRAVRMRAGRRQHDVAASAGLSQSTVSVVERGHLDRLTLDAIRRIGASLGISIDLQARWRGGELDRLLDRAHARLVERTVSTLAPSGWVVRVEYAFNHFGDRGSADIVAWHAPTATLLLIEGKSALVDLQDLFRAMAVKARVSADPRDAGGLGGGAGRPNPRGARDDAEPSDRRAAPRDLRCRLAGSDVGDPALAPCARRTTDRRLVLK